MKLMRLEGDRVAEIVDVPDRVTEMVAPATGTDPATYAERPARPDDFFHPDLGFVPHETGAEVGMTRTKNGWAIPDTDPEILARSIAAIAEARLRRIRAVALDFYAAGEVMPKAWVDYRQAITTIRDNPPRTDKGFTWPVAPVKP